MIRFSTAPQTPTSDNQKAGPPMSNDDTLARALSDVRRQRSSMEADHERIGSELAKLRAAEKSLAAIVEGVSLDDSEDSQPKRRRASTDDDQPRATRGPRGPRANSAKGRLKALIEEAGSEGLTHAEIVERLTDVAANTLNTYLSVMSNSGELARQGDVYRAGTPTTHVPPGNGNDNEEEYNSDEDRKTKASE